MKFYFSELFTAGEVRITELLKIAVTGAVCIVAILKCGFEAICIIGFLAICMKASEV